MATIYGFECCRFGHPIDHWVERCPVDRCGAAVTAIYESPETRAAARQTKAVMSRLDARSHNAQGFDVVVFHEGPNGKISWPAHAEAPLRPGYIRREARTLREMDAVVKRINRTETDKAEQQLHRDEIRKAAHRSENRPALRQRMQSMSPKGRAIAQAAMDMNDARRPTLNTPNAYLEIREFDASNRDPHLDKRTGWRSRRA